MWCEKKPRGDDPQQEHGWPFQDGYQKEQPTFPRAARVSKAQQQFLDAYASTSSLNYLPLSRIVNREQSRQCKKSTASDTADGCTQRARSAVASKGYGCHLVGPQPFCWPVPVLLQEIDGLFCPGERTEGSTIITSNVLWRIFPPISATTRSKSCRSLKCTIYFLRHFSPSQESIGFKKETQTPCCRIQFANRTAPQGR